MQESISETKDLFYKYVGVSKIFLTLLHEYCHILQYLLRAEYNAKDKDCCNYFVKSFISKRNDDDYSYYESIKIKNKVNYPMEGITKLTKKQFEKKINYDNLHKESNLNRVIFSITKLI